MLSGAYPLFIGKPTIELERIDSTNVYAAELIATGNPSEGTVILAHHQTQGRGQFGRDWLTDEGKNITLSIILKPAFIPAQYQFDLTRIIALAVAEWIENYIDKQIYIKWPNDIYIEDKKIGGILIQNMVSKSTLQSSVIGIGINVNQAHFDPRIPNPTSFYLENKKEYSLGGLCQQLYKHIEQTYLKAKQGHMDRVTAGYMERLYRLNEERSYLLFGENKVLATIRDIEKQGKIILEIDGERLSYSLNEVQHIQ